MGIIRTKVRINGKQWVFLIIALIFCLRKKFFNIFFPHSIKMKVCAPQKQHIILGFKGKAKHAFKIIIIKVSLHMFFMYLSQMNS
jgi:hypothetical protein